MFAKLKSVGLYGLSGYIVDVEADLSQGLPTFDIVGLPDAAVRESRERVRSSLKNCGFDFPVSRITVNLAPADVKKEGPVYDLPMLLALLVASGQIKYDLTGCVFVGELSLCGEIKPLDGILPMAIKVREKGFKRFFIPRENAPEGSVVEGLEILPVGNIRELLCHLSGEAPIKPALREDYASQEMPLTPDFADVSGQYEARRGLEIAAAGGHNILLVGPPGSGKSMLARRLPSILPEMSFEESIETTKIHSIAGILPPGVPLITSRPFRSPHHTISAATITKRVDTANAANTQLLQYLFLVLL